MFKGKFLSTYDIGSLPKDAGIVLVEGKIIVPINYEDNSELNGLEIEISFYYIGYLDAYLGDNKISLDKAFIYKKELLDSYKQEEEEKIFIKLGMGKHSWQVKGLKNLINKKYWKFGLLDIDKWLSIHNIEDYKEIE